MSSSSTPDSLRDDANRLGVRAGDLVRLTTRRGRIELPARIDYRAQPAPGNVFIPTFDEGHPIQRLTLEAGCPVSGQPASTSCAVRVERAGPRERP